MFLCQTYSETNSLKKRKHFSEEQGKSKTKNIGQIEQELPLNIV